MALIDGYGLFFICKSTIVSNFFFISFGGSNLSDFFVSSFMVLRIFRDWLSVIGLDCSQGLIMLLSFDWWLVASMTILFCCKFEVSSTLFLLKSLSIRLLIKALMCCSIIMKNYLPKKYLYPGVGLEREKHRNALLKKTLLGTSKQLFMDLGY